MGLNGRFIFSEELYWQRSVLHRTDCRTPAHGLYKCGASSHPAVGVSGIPRHNAAREILRDRKGRK